MRCFRIDESLLETPFAILFDEAIVIAPKSKYPRFAVGFVNADIVTLHSGFGLAHEANDGFHQEVLMVVLLVEVVVQVVVEVNKVQPLVVLQHL